MPRCISSVCLMHQPEDLSQNKLQLRQVWQISYFLQPRLHKAPKPIPPPHTPPLVSWWASNVFQTLYRLSVHRYRYWWINIPLQCLSSTFDITIPNTFFFPYCVQENQHEESLRSYLPKNICFFVMRLLFFVKENDTDISVYGNMVFQKQLLYTDEILEEALCLLLVNSFDLNKTILILMIWSGIRDCLRKSVGGV